VVPTATAHDFDLAETRIADVIAESDILRFADRMQRLAGRVAAASRMSAPD
jgi:hypothetical protein